MTIMTKDDFVSFVKDHVKTGLISDSEIDSVKSSLAPLKGAQFNILSLPADVIAELEPSQVGTIVGTLVDACIPILDRILDPELFKDLGLTKNPGILGNREGYPDYLHKSGKRIELKLLFVDNKLLTMKRPPTKREPSARLTQKVTFKNVIQDTDLILIVAYTLKRDNHNHERFCPTIIDYELIPAIDLILARDIRLYNSGGVWFGNFDTPVILSHTGKTKLLNGELLDTTRYGRKESEGMDFNEDTNFGKLKRIPENRLKLFLKKYE